MEVITERAVFFTPSIRTFLCSYLHTTVITLLPDGIGEKCVSLGMTIFTTFSCKQHTPVYSMHLLFEGVPEEKKSIFVVNE